MFGMFAIKNPVARPRPPCSMQWTDCPQIPPQSKQKNKAASINIAPRARPGKTLRVSQTLFEKIIAREIPADIVYEDDLVLAFHDINPKAPTHVLIIPKKPIPRIAEAAPEDHQVLGHLLLKAREIAGELGLHEKGFRLVFNNGPDAGETVPHLHLHILGGRTMTWPPG